MPVPAHHLPFAPEVLVRHDEDVHQAAVGKEADEEEGVDDVELHAPRHRCDHGGVGVELDQRPEVRDGCRGEPGRAPAVEDGHVDPTSTKSLSPTGRTRTLSTATTPDAR